MSASVFTPKQIAQALGVSESSVKRWVDSGRLKAARTAGGHRKVPLPSIVEFVRHTGHDLTRPEVLGMTVATQRGTLEDAREPLYKSLIKGDEAGCREMVLSWYQQGESITRISDRLISPVFRRVGEDWETGVIQVHQERLSCEVMMATLHELRRWLPVPPENAPLALTATPLADFAEVPIRMVELMLISEGWKVRQAGSGLPLDQILESVVFHKPRLICLSVTHLQDATGFADRYFNELVGPTRKELGASDNGGPSHVIGGGALDDICHDLQCELYASRLADLREYQETIYRQVA